MALLTGLRRDELLGLRWENVDLEHAEARLHTSGHLLVVPLVPDAVDLLRSLPRTRRSSYVFPSPVVPGAKLHSLRRPWARVQARMWLLLHPEEAHAIIKQAIQEVRARPKHASKHARAVQARAFQIALAHMERSGETVSFEDLHRTARLTEHARRQALQKFSDLMRSARASASDLHIPV